MTKPFSRHHIHVMIATLHIPFGYGDCVGGFEYGKEIEQEEYANMLIKDYNDHSYGIDDMMTSRYGHNISVNSFTKENRKYRQQNQEFFSVDCYVSDKSFSDMRVEELLDLYKKGESFVIVIRFKDIRDIKADPDVETDIKLWMRETLKIDRSPKLTDVEKFKSFSKKDLKLTFKGSKMSAVLLDCKMVNVYSNTKFGFWVKKIRFTKDK